ncbi:MAG: Gfo/Idh/MocA family oxidoreductase [Oscillospiraceae bacterium]|jgi:predicted dehydrogenase|nr:Gfo/Idh/MocA family oxidoreductase [Oscillospiraceae bacterium]
MADDVLAQFTPEAQAVKQSTGKKLKVGIIGTGWIAESHIQSYKRMEDVEVVAAADLIPGKAEAFMKQWGVDGVRFYPDHLAMLEAEKDLDAVSVCTYNTTHAVCTIDALNRGVSVLLEKPMCVTTQEAIDICRAEKASGKVLSIGFQPRFDVNMQMIKKIVNSGELGDIYYIQTGGGRRRGIPNSTFIEQKTAGIGALGDIGCYSLDVVLNAIGYPKPLTVSGYTSAFFGPNPLYNNPADAARFDVDDFAAAFVRLEGGIILDFRIAWAMHVDTPGDSILFGTKGALRIPSTDCWNGSVGGAMTLYHDVAGERAETQIPILQNDPKKGGLFDQKIRSFLDAVLEGGTSPVPARQILHNQAILDGILQSSKQGREITIDLPDEI